MNLLKETINVIATSKHEIKDIIFIGSEKSGYSCSWNEFTLLANYDYDNGYGGAEVASDLKIVFSDNSLLYRDEYDGSEWWAYQIPFKILKEKKQIKSIFCKNFHLQDLTEIHEQL